MDKNFFLIPTNSKIKLIKLKKKKYLILLFSKNCIISFFLPKYCYFDLSTNVVQLFYFKGICDKIIFNNKYINLLNINLRYSELLKQIKITFKGKSYKVRKAAKKMRTIQLDFHKAHKSILLFRNLFIKKLRKQKLLFLSYDYFFLLKVAGDIVNIRPLNSYTKRGIRLKKQKYCKLVSKKSLKKK